MEIWLHIPTHWYTNCTSINIDSHWDSCGSVLLYIAFVYKLIRLRILRITNCNFTVTNFGMTIPELWRLVSLYLL